jgi:serine/threonine protein phosphatase 1
MAQYLMTDIHGFYEPFMQMLDKIKFSDSDRLLILGDSIDRGPESCKMLDFIFQHTNVESLMGNHELMFLEEVMSELGRGPRSTYRDWFHNGGEPVLKQMLAREKKDPDYISQIHKEISKWPYYQIFKDYGRKPIVCIHAGYSCWKNENGTNPKLKTMLNATNDFWKVWMREEFILYQSHPRYISIFGHTPTAAMGAEGKIWYSEDKSKICLDTSAYRFNTLACLRLDDMEEFYVTVEKTSKRKSSNKNVNKEKIKNE